MHAHHHHHRRRHQLFLVQSLVLKQTKCMQNVHHTSEFTSTIYDNNPEYSNEKIYTNLCIKNR